MIDVSAGETHTIPGTYPSGHVNGGVVQETGTLLVGPGSLVNDGTFSNHGLIRAKSSDTLINNLGVLENWGTVEGQTVMNAAFKTIYNYGDFNNEFMFINNGDIKNNESMNLMYLINDGQIDNYGTMNVGYSISNDWVINNEGDFTFDGNLHNDLSFFNKGNLTLDGSVENNKYLTNSGGNIQNYADIQNNDTITNSGTIDSYAAIFNDGTFDNSGTLNLYGTLVNTAAFNNTAGGAVLVGLGGDTGSFSGNIVNDGSLIFSRSDALAYAGSISGAGTVGKQGLGALTMSGDSSAFTGQVAVDAGTLVLNGSIANAAVTVSDGATLGGNGMAGSVAVLDGGTIAPGNSVGTLELGSLVLNQNSRLAFELDSAGVNDLIAVSGALTLDGILDVTDLPYFGNGVYTLIEYGTLAADNGLELGATPDGFDYTLGSGSGAVTLAVAGGTAGAVQFWDGSFMTPGGTLNGRGGDGIWTGSATNWTNQAGTGNSAWSGDFAVFAGAAGTVGVDGAVDFTGMQFLTDGYVIEAGAGGQLVTNTAASTIRTGAGIGATISAPITGSGGLVKLEGGTLTLSGANSYAGGTTISGGIVAIDNGDALGTGAVILDGGTLLATQTLTLDNPGLVWTAGTTGTIAAASGTTLTLNPPGQYFRGANASIRFGAIGQDGTIVLGAGPSTSIASNSASDITLAAGTLRIGGGIATNFFDNSSITEVNLAAGTLLDINGYAVGITNLTGSGTIANNQAGAFPRQVTAIANADTVFSGAIVDGLGHVSLTKFGAATLQLAGANTYSGQTTIAGGTLDVAGGLALPDTTTVSLWNAAGTRLLVSESETIGGLAGGGANGGAVEIASGQTLTVGANDGYDIFNGTITGDGGLIKIGSGQLTLTGNASYADETTIAGGTLTVTGQQAALNSYSIIVGYGGDGTFLLDDEARAETTVDFGVGADAAGDATISNGALLVAGENTLIGAFSGPGNLSISSGGRLETAGTGFIGTLFSNGYTVIDGPGSQWTIGEQLVLNQIDNPARTARLLLTNGGRISVQGTPGAQGLGGQGSTVQIGDGGTPGIFDLLTFDTRGSIVFDHLATNYIFATDVSGDGRIEHQAGTTALAGDSSAFTGATAVSGGTLTVANALGGSASVTGGSFVVDGMFDGDLAASTAGIVSGMGTITGNGDFTGGGVLAGAQGQVLSIEGNVLMDNTSAVDVALGSAPSTALFAVGGNLTLDGTLNLNDQGGLGAGIYRIFDYAGTLTDGGLTIGALPTGINAADIVVQTAVAGEVNLMSTVVTPLGFWDGGDTALHDNDAIDGGAGTWRAGGFNWTLADGSLNGSFQPNPTFAVFQNIGGLVRVDASAGAIGVTGMQFANAGYVIEGDAIALQGAGGQTIIRVGDGTPGSAGLTATIGAELSGASMLVKSDDGTLILTGNNTYTGGTTIASGTLQIGNGGSHGSIIGDVSNDSVLAFNRSAALTYAGEISGAGIIRQIGSGRTELTGDSSGFAGTTMIENGTLVVNGQLGGMIGVLPQGRLQGSGMMGNAIVAGMIAPGNSIGVLNVATITFIPGSIYEVEVNAAGLSDQIIASGAATITGGRVNVLAGAGNYQPLTDYTILTANGGIAGAAIFDGVTSNMAFLDPSLSYDANHVYLRLRRNAVAFAGVGLTPNQIATGGGVESLGGTNPVFGAVVIVSADQARYAFDQLSGEIYASARTALIEDSRFVRNAVNDRLRAAFGHVGIAGEAVVAFDNGTSRTVPATTDGFAVWGQGFGARGHNETDGNAARLDRSTGGFFVGVDGPAFDTWRIGAVAGYSHATFNVGDRLSSGTSENYHIGLYGGTQWGNIAFRTGAAYAWHDISAARNVAFPGFGNTLNGAYAAGTAQVFGELGYGIDIAAARFEPFANIAYVNLHTDAFAEKGGPAALTGTPADAASTFTTLGLRASTSFDLGGTTATAKAMIGWKHVFGDLAPPIRMQFAGGDSFGIAGVPTARDAGVVEVGLDFALSPAATLDVSYGSQFGSGLSDHSLKASFSARF